MTFLRSYISKNVAILPSFLDGRIENSQLEIIFVSNMKVLLHCLPASSVTVEKLKAIQFLNSFDVILWFFLGYL